MKDKIMKYLLLIFISLLFSCTHYKAISYSELENTGLIGRWEMSLDPYFLEIDCNGTMNFIKPSKVLYGDQKGNGFVVTEIKKNALITGPVLRVNFPIEEWPHDDNGRTLMTLDGRIWHKAKNYKCE
jgi:hypothetical protein